MSTSSKILVIRFSSIGDIVLTTPVVRGLKKQLHAEVHFLTKPTYAELLQPNPYIDKIILLDASLSTTLQELRAQAYDYLIDLHHNLRTLRIKQNLRVPSYAFNKLNVQKWLYTNLKINRLPAIHIVDRYLETVADLGVKNDGEGLDYFFADPTDPPDRDQEARSSADQVPETASIVFAIGGAHATKRLPVEQIVKLCNRLTGVIRLIGGKEDRSIGAQIAAACPAAVNHCGQLNLSGSARLIQEAALVISHDTGMMHIAAALRKPILSIWGNTVPAFGMWPYYPVGMPPAYRFEVAGLGCRPCSKIGYDRCPKGHFKCMRQQDIALIADTANKLLENADLG